mgnify:CR=1 FL=1
MKNFLLALMVVLTTCTLAVAQTTVVRDSIGKVKVTVTKDNKANTNNTAVTVIGVDTADADSADVNANSSNVSTTHGKASFTFDSDDSDFPFHNVSAGGGILVAIIAIIAVFGFPVFILFVIFFFRYKNRKARYRLAEQALAAGQPLPAEFIRDHKASRTPLRVSVFSSSSGQSPANSELELSAYSLHSWVSDNGLSVANNRLKTQMLPGCIRVIRMKKRTRITLEPIVSKSSLPNPKRKTKE